MAKYVWDERYGLGVPVVDEQHRHWFELTNTFLELAKAGGADTAAVRQALAAAVGHARIHFRAEEALMRRIRFPRSEFEWHKMTHDAFVERINALAKRCREGRPRVIAEMSAFMAGWLTKHILEADVKYVGFYMSRTATFLGDYVARLRAKTSRRMRSST